LTPESSTFIDHAHVMLSRAQIMLTAVRRPGRVIDRGVWRAVGRL